MSKKNKVKEVSADQIVDNGKVVEVNESKLSIALEKLAETNESKEAKNDRLFADRVAKYRANVAKNAAKRAKIARIENDED